jgi:hypothetical protein
VDINFKKQSKIKIHMRRNDFQYLRTARPGSTLFCDTGVLWVTQVGDQRDYVLQPGEKMVLTRRGKVLIEAMRDADLLVA